MQMEWKTVYTVCSDLSVRKFRNIMVMCPKVADRMTNSPDPGQSLFWVYTCLSKYEGHVGVWLKLTIETDMLQISLIDNVR